MDRSSCLMDKMKGFKVLYMHLLKHDRRCFEDHQSCDWLIVFSAVSFHCWWRFFEANNVGWGMMHIQNGFTFNNTKTNLLTLNPFPPLLLFFTNKPVAGNRDIQRWKKEHPPTVKITLWKTEYLLWWQCKEKNSVYSRHQRVASKDRMKTYTKCICSRTIIKSWASQLNLAVSHLFRN